MTNKKRNQIDVGEEKFSRRKKQKRMADSNWGEGGGEEDEVGVGWLYGGADKATGGSMKQSTLTVVRYSDKEWVEKGERERVNRNVVVEKIEKPPTDQYSVWEDGDSDEWMGELLETVENKLRRMGGEEMSERMRMARQVKLNELWDGGRDRSVSDKYSEGETDCGVTKTGNTTSEKRKENKIRRERKKKLMLTK